MSDSDRLKTIEDALLGLASVEEELEQAERAAEVARLRSVQKIYTRRSEFTSLIDKFWHIVLSQHPDFSEYVRSQDFKYLELIKEIHVTWGIDDSGEASSPDNFSITFKFDQLGDDFPEQTITKNFTLEKIDPEEAFKNNEDEEGDDDIVTERLISDSVPITWPKSYDSINPSKIANKKTPEGKKNYRAGMKSFFGWFKWTGKKPGKEFPSGDDLARLFADDIFTNAVKYYTEAQRDGLEEECDSDASEPLDLSEDDEEHVEKKQKTN